MMNLLIEYWQVIFSLLALVIVSATTVYQFVGLPTEKQQQKVKEWLIWACIEAEKNFDTGTGQLKLRKVYDLFVSIPSFGTIARLITFETFSSWVDIALDKAKNMIITNPGLANYVYGDNSVTEVAKLKSQLETRTKGE